mgnify:CR=1 FL=1
MAKKMVRGFLNIAMVTNMRVIGKMIKYKVEEYIIGHPVKNMMENGKIVKEMVKVLTYGQVVTHMMDIG